MTLGETVIEYVNCSCTLSFCSSTDTRKNQEVQRWLQIILRKNELKFFLDGADNGLKLDDQGQKLDDQKQNGTKFHSWAG